MKEDMMSKYMLILGGADLDKRSGNANLAPAMFERYLKWLQSIRQSEAYVGSYKLYERLGR